MVMRIETPAIKISIARLQCTQCGAEANASCNCGKSYVPAAQRVAEYDKANPGKSTRAAATDLGIASGTVTKARKKSGASTEAPAKVIGIDGKEYSAKRPSPDEDVEHEEGLRVIAARGILNRAKEAKGLADLGKLQADDVTEAMIRAAEGAAAAWNALAQKLRGMN
jgi:hypothetical protein